MKRVSVSSSDVISQLRLPLIVLVTYAHSYGAVAPGYSLLESGWDSYEVVKLLVSQTLVKVAVPAFFVISGYLFFRNVEQWNAQVYWGKLRRRLWTLLLPYVAWNLLMAVKLLVNGEVALSLPSLGRVLGWFLWVYIPQAGMQTDWLGHENWMTAPANMPLWFLRDLMVVSLLTPLVYSVLRRWGGPVVAVLTVVYLSGIGAFAVPGLSMYAVYFFSLGAFLGIRRVELTAAALRLEVPAYVLSTLLIVAMMLTYSSPLTPHLSPLTSRLSPLTFFHSPLMLAFRLVGAVAVFCVAWRLLSVTRRRLPAVVCRASYFLYLGHYVFFLSFIDTWMFTHLSPLTSHPSPLTLHYLLAPLLKAVIFVAVYVGWSKFVQRFFREKLV